MKKRNKNRTIVRIMVFLALVLITTSTQAARSVREMMKNEVTDVSSLQTFYTKHNSAYERRYFLQYLPVYLEKFGVSELPSWITNALDDALNSEYVPLSIAAIKSIGTLKLDSFSDKLTQGFIASEQEVYLSLSYRIAVLEAFKQFNDSDKIRSNLSQLLQNFPQGRIFDPDFTLLMEVTIRFGAEENAQLLSKYETRIDTMLDRQIPGERRNPDLDRIKELIERTKRSLALKGGQDE